jgi:hypothetical protein
MSWMKMKITYLVLLIVFHSHNLSDLPQGRIPEERQKFWPRSHPPARVGAKCPHPGAIRHFGGPQKDRRIHSRGSEKWEFTNKIQNMNV